ncbi:MAG: hypothetical protein KatS3mg131_0312 [Candidatus Tectimicrobiota bacterium]|nr:MAG: hypothetical protein KatS3mg131_0312 [Candidatus Tectomicrobia bacterium]
MQAPLFIRPLEDPERAALKAGLRSSNGFTVRRCHILLLSADGVHVPAIAKTLRCNEQTVRNAIHDFHRRGLAALQPKSSRPHTTQAVFNAERLEQLRALLHQSPRAFGKDTSVWTLELAAEVCFAQGITPRRVSYETIRAAIARLGGRWKRAKHWMTSPDPAYQRKKNGAIA